MDIFETLKSVGKFVNAAQNAEASLKMVELTEKITNLVEEKAALQQRNRDLEVELATQKKLTVLGEDLQFRNNARWKSDGSGPYCSACWDTKKQLVNLHAQGNPAWAECPACQKTCCVYPERDSRGTVIDEGHNSDPYASL